MRTPINYFRLTCSFRVQHYFIQYSLIILNGNLTTRPDALAFEVDDGLDGFAVECLQTIILGCIEIATTMERAANSFGPKGSIKTLLFDDSNSTILRKSKYIELASVNLYLERESPFSKKENFMFASSILF